MKKRHLEEDHKQIGKNLMNDKKICDKLDKNVFPNISK